MYPYVLTADFTRIKMILDQISSVYKTTLRHHHLKRETRCRYQMRIPHVVTISPYTDFTASYTLTTPKVSGVAVPWERPFFSKRAIISVPAGNCSMEPPRYS